MRITSEADYAVRIVYRLAEKNGRIGAKEIAENVHVTMRFTLKILRKLVIAEIAKSYKGAGGGYTLARPADAISVLDVIEAIDGPVLLNKCLEGDMACSAEHVPDSCIFRGIWRELSEKVQASLAEESFADLIAGRKKS